MAWNEIKEKKDIDKLLEEYYGFHDSCLVELNYKNGMYVDEEGSMNFGTDEERELHMIFQSQCTKRVLELCFTSVKKFYMADWQDNYGYEILDCYLEILTNEKESLVIWADSKEFDPRKGLGGEKESELTTTYIIAGNLKYRYLRVIKEDFNRGSKKNR